MKRTRYSRDQWAEWLREQPVSGLSVKSFCDGKGVSTNSFYLWRRKLADEIQRPADHGPFVPVTFVGNEPVRIELPGGAKMEVPSDELSLRRVLSIVWELGGSS